MIKANFNTYASYVTDSLYQWDLNQVLSVSGLNLSVVPEVHFSNANMDKAIVRQATKVNNVVSVAIPNSLLQDPLTIHAHIGIYEGDTFKVVELVEIPIVARKRPSDYRIEDADEEIYSFKALENHIANMVKLSEFNANNATIAARIDNIIAHNNDTNGNTELVDIRTDLDGVVHPSAGTAIRKQIESLTVPKRLNADKWLFTPFEKQPFMYCDIFNGNTVIDQIEYSASYLCYGGNVESLDTIGAYVMKRGRLLNEIPLNATKDDYTLLVYTDISFTGIAYLMHTDFSGTYPYFSADVSLKSGWNVVNFEKVVTGTIGNVDRGCRFVAIRVNPKDKATPELLNGLRFSLIRNFKQLLDSYLEKSRAIVNGIGYDFVAWGDSLTQGSGGNGTTFLQIVANKFNGTYYNGGQGGENPSLIACRAGANNLYIPADHSPNIPFSGVFDFGGGNLYTASNSAEIPVFIGGETYRLIRDSSGLYSIPELTDVSEYPRPIVLEQQYNKGKVTIIWMGTNSDRTYEGIYPYIDRIIDILPNKNYIVIGLTYNPDVSLLETTNSQLKQRYGNKFIDIREMILQYGLARANIMPTVEDTAAIESGFMPPSLLNDNVHFNAAGYTLIGNFLVDKIYALGYDKFLE